MALSQKHVIASQAGTTFTRAQVYQIIKHYVYPPCKKEATAIRMNDNLETNLGYVGNSRRLLAPKTNNTFALTPPNRFTGPEMDDLNDVASHVNATCDKLRSAGRLVETTNVTAPRPWPNPPKSK